METLKIECLEEHLNSLRMPEKAQLNVLNCLPGLIEGFRPLVNYACYDLMGRLVVSGGHGDRKTCR